MKVDTAIWFGIFFALIGLIPDETTTSNLHSLPFGGSPRVADKLSGAGAFGFKMREIPVRNSTKPALVDDDLFETISAHVWWLNSNGYAQRCVRIDGKNGASYMHREILRAPKGRQVDHINHVKLDNRVSNLRLASRSQNHGNLVLSARKTSKSRSAYKGVDFRGVKWRSRITKDGHQINLGEYDTEAEAAAAYNGAAIVLFGEFALLNPL